MDALDRALYEMDRVVKREDVKKAASAIPPGAMRKIVHRDADHRIVAIDEFPLATAPDLPASVVESGGA